MLETEKRYSRSFPLKTKALLVRRKPRWQKKRKNGGSKIAQKIVFSPVLEKDFVSRDTLFGRDEKYLQEEQDGAQIFKRDVVKINAHILLSH